MKKLDSKLMRSFLKSAGDSLKGEWLLLGGTLLPAVGLNIRSTVDIDLIGLGATEAAQGLELMEVAESLGLSVETVNQAAAYFLKKVGYSRKDLLLLHKGKSAIIYRPSVELYWRLKVARLSESDFSDCQHYYQYSRDQKETINAKNLRQIVASAMHSAVSLEARRRLKQLEAIIADKA